MQQSFEQHVKHKKIEKEIVLYYNKIPRHKFGYPKQICRESQYLLNNCTTITQSHTILLVIN